jgi:hypothetical protein
MMRLRAKIRKVDGSGALCAGSGLRRWRVAGSISDDIGREKQNELTGQLVRVRHDLVELEAASADIQETLNEALDLVRDCAAAYRSADPAPGGSGTKRSFERVEIDCFDVNSTTSMSRRGLASQARCKSRACW